MKVDQMRLAIANVYKGTLWRMKVLYDMPDRQIIAMYKDMERTGRLKQKEPKYTGEKCEQLNMFDILKEQDERNSENGAI